MRVVKVGIIKFVDGVVGNINMTFDAWNSNLPMLEVYGTDGTLIVPDPNIFGGRIMIFRKEKMLNSVQRSIFSEYYESNLCTTNEEQIMEEIPQIYYQPIKNMCGLGVLDMAFALVNNRKHRLNETLAYHVTEA